MLEAKETAITDTFCSYIGADEGAHTAAIAIGSIAAAIAVFFIIAICCGAFVPCCAGCAGLALLVRTLLSAAPEPLPTVSPRLRLGLQLVVSLTRRKTTHHNIVVNAESNPTFATKPLYVGPA